MFGAYFSYYLALISQALQKIKNKAMISTITRGKPVCPKLIEKGYASTQERTLIDINLI